MSSPFNEAKYQALLEGQIEFSEVMLSALDDIKKRLDSDYYTRNQLALAKKITSLHGTTLDAIQAVLDCSAFYPSIIDAYNFNFMGVPFLRVNEIQEGIVIVGENTAFLPKEILEQNINTIAIGYPHDIIIAKGGNTLAKVGLLTEEYKSYALSRDLILLRTNELRSCNKYFLWVFLHSKHGQSILWRTASQTGQPHLTLPSIKEIKLPRFSPNFESGFEAIYKKSIEYKNFSIKTYAQAEEILLTEIGLKDFEPSNDPVNIKNFSESFRASGRLDAEYYQRKYDDYINLVYAYKKGSEPISQACTHKGHNFNPEAKTEYRYIELSNIGKSGGINGCTVNIGSELPSRARRLVNKNDVIISSIEGSLDSCALVTEEYDGALCSTGFYVLRSEKLNAETLLVLFKSEPMQNLLKQRCSGTILTAINKDEFLSIPIPLIQASKQQEIAVLVEQSFSLKKQSEELLELAKRAVEIAIEQSEQTALQYIKDNE